MRKWQFQEAKAKLSEVSRCAHAEGPQVITRFGKDDLVVLTKDEYDRIAPAKAAPSLLEFLREGGLVHPIELSDEDLDPDGPLHVEDLFARDSAEYVPDKTFLEDLQDEFGPALSNGA